MKISISLILFLLGTASISFSQDKNTSNSIGHWQTIECVNALNARHESCFVGSGDKFYMLAGRGIKPINIFDPKTNTWNSGAEPPIEMHHFQGVSYKGKIYVIGAMTGKYPYETPVENIYIYDTKNNAWSKGDEIPEVRRRGSAGVVVVGNKAIVTCGIVDGHNSKHVAWTDEYDFKTGEWKVLADAPRARDHFAAAEKNGKIYCAGGRNSSYATGQTFELTIPEVDVYDIKSDTWTSLSQNMPTQRAGASSVFLGNDLIVIGGESANIKEAHSDVEAFNLKTNAWRELSPLNRGRHGTQAIIYKNAIYIAAGSGNRGGSPELDSIEKFVFDK